MNAHARSIGTPSEPDMLARARALGDLISAEANNSEELGTMTEPVVSALKEAELFWMLVPRELGGSQCDMLACLDVWEEVARADGSAGWSLMANSTGTAVAAGFCGDAAVEEMFGGNKRPIMAGMLGPGGTCVETSGGFKGSGKYRFGSGSRHADWLGAGMFILDDNIMRKLPNGDPQVRVCFVPSKDVKFDVNWDVFGLNGTGSIDYEVKDAFVPAGRSLERTTTKSLRDWRLYDIGIAGLACAGHTGVALGIMKRALEEITRIAFARTRPAYKTVLGEQAVFRHDFAYNEAAYQAARAFTHDVYRDAQATLERGDALTPAQRQRFRQNVIYVHRVAADVVRFCYTMGGSDSLRNPSALGRCMRDITAATQHIFVDTIAMVDAVVPILDDWKRN